MLNIGADNRSTPNCKSLWIKASAKLIHLNVMIDNGKWRKFGQDTRVTPLLFYEKCHGNFNDHRESEPQLIVSAKGRCFLQYNVPVTILGC